MVKLLHVNNLSLGMVMNSPSLRTANPRSEAGKISENPSQRHGISFV
jgi:hypothetical protein